MWKETAVEALQLPLNHQPSKPICVVAPFPPPYGGIRLQAEKLMRHLVEEGVPAYSIPTNPRPPELLRWVQGIPGLRSLICEAQYLVWLVADVPRVRVIHHLAASGFNFFVRSAPVLVLGRLWRKKIILNYRGGNAVKFLRDWHLCVVPLMRLADQIVVPSEFLQGTFHKYGLETTLLPNIADPELFAWRDRTRFSPHLLVTRHLDPIYNVECLLRMMRTLQIRFPDATLTVAGTGSEERRLRGLVRAWGLQGIDFRGHVPHKDLPSLYESHDIYVNSSNVDNFPGALVEAACCGLPIVSTSAGGIRDMISNRQTGILVNRNDHESLAAGVTEIVENANFGRQLAWAARTWAEQFSWLKVWPVLSHCYGLPAVTPQEVRKQSLEERHRRELVR